LNWIKDTFMNNNNYVSGLIGKRVRYTVQKREPNCTYINTCTIEPKTNDCLYCSDNQFEGMLIQSENGYAIVLDNGNIRQVERFVQPKSQLIELGYGPMIKNGRHCAFKFEVIE
jgi:hypothetical protein